MARKLRKSHHRMSKRSITKDIDARGAITLSRNVVEGSTVDHQTQQRWLHLAMLWTATCFQLYSQCKVHRVVVRKCIPGCYVQENYVCTTNPFVHKTFHFSLAQMSGHGVEGRWTSNWWLPCPHSRSLHKAGSCAARKTPRGSTSPTDSFHPHIAFYIPLFKKK